MSLHNNSSSITRNWCAIYFINKTFILAFISYTYGLLYYFDVKKKNAVRVAFAGNTHVILMGMV